jgi:beta-phosphoglucomutase-like phosphatase (HAD superfamily)
MPAELRGLLLDFDGTIADTERHGHRVAYNHAFAEMGLGWTWDESLYGELLRVAGGKERLRFYIERHHPHLLADALASSLIPRIHEAKIRHFGRLAPTIPLRHGVLRLLGEASHAGIRIVIATTAAKPGVEALLAQEPALTGMVTLIAASDAVERKKPAPDVYLWAMEQLRLSADECVAVEDSEIGLHAALGAGLATVVTVSDYTTLDDFTGARTVLTSLGDPGAPARSIRGLAPGNGMVDLAFLRTILHADR